MPAEETCCCVGCLSGSGAGGRTRTNFSLNPMANGAYANGTISLQVLLGNTFFYSVSEHLGDHFIGSRVAG